MRFPLLASQIMACLFAVYLPAPTALAQSVMLVEQTLHDKQSLPAQLEPPAHKDEPPTPAPAAPPCKEHCGSSAEGYEWARVEGIASPAKCPPKGSPDFISGCQQFVNDLIEQSKALEQAEKGLPPEPPPAPLPLVETPTTANTTTTVKDKAPAGIVSSPPATTGNAAGPQQPPPPPAPHETTLLVSPQPAPPQEMKDEDKAAEGTPPTSPMPAPELPTPRRLGEEVPVGSSYSFGRVP